MTSISKNFWANLTKSEIKSLINLHKVAAAIGEAGIKGVKATMNEMQNAVKKEMAEALRSYLIEQEAAWFEDRVHAIEACIPIKEDGQPNYPSDFEQMTEEIGKMAWLDPNMEANLILAKSQATDGYKQANDAFKLLENVYDFLVRLHQTTRVVWIHRAIIDLKQRIENFLPGIKEKHS